MAALNFPNSPTLDQEYTVADVTWRWNGTRWVPATTSLADLVEAVIADYLAANGNAVADSFGFVGGTTLVSAQTTAPTGWTKATTHNNKALRLVTGTVSTGGSNPFTASFASRTPTGTNSATSLSTAQLASHTHDITVFGAPAPTVPLKPQATTGTNVPSAVTTTPAGSGSTHNHTLTGDAMDFAVTYVDVTIITKD